MEFTTSFQYLKIDRGYLGCFVEISFVDVSDLNPVIFDGELSEFGFVLVWVAFVVFLLFFSVDSGPALGSFLLIAHGDIFWNVLLVFGFEISFDCDELGIFFAQSYSGQVAELDSLTELVEEREGKVFILLVSELPVGPVFCGVDLEVL